MWCIFMNLIEAIKPVHKQTKTEIEMEADTLTDTDKATETETGKKDGD